METVILHSSVSLQVWYIAKQPPFYITSLLKRQGLLLHLLTRGWFCDHFWTIEVSESDRVPVTNMDCRSLESLFINLLNSCVNKPNLVCMTMKPSHAHHPRWQSTNPILVTEVILDQPNSSQPVSRPQRHEWTLLRSAKPIQINIVVQKYIDSWALINTYCLCSLHFGRVCYVAKANWCISSV